MVVKRDNPLWVGHLYKKNPGIGPAVVAEGFKSSTTRSHSITDRISASKSDYVLMDPGSNPHQVTIFMGCYSTPNVSALLDEH